MQREILVISIQICCVGIGKGFQCNRSLYLRDSLIFRVEHLWDVALQFIPLRLYIFNCETNDRTPNLDGHGMLCFQSQLILQEDYRAELRCIILDVEAVLLTFDDSMTSADTDIIDTYLTLVTTTQFEFWLFWRDREQMNIPWCVLVEWHGFQ